MNTQIGFRLWARRHLRAGAFLVLVLLVVSLLALAPIIGAADYTVNDESELIAAIAGANSAGTGTHTITLAADITLTQNLPAFDNSSASAIVIAGGNHRIGCGTTLDHVFTVNAGTTVEMQQLIISGCTVNTSVIVNVGSLTLAETAVDLNVHDGPGAIYSATGAALTLADSVVSGNNRPTGAGGGIYNEGTLTAEDSQITGNRAGVYDDEPIDPVGDDGGGLYSSGSATLRRVTVSDNFAYYDGGGIFNTGDMLLEDCIVDHNAAGHNAAGIDSYGTLQLIGGSLSDNNSSQAGAGLYNNQGGDAVLDDVDIFRNGKRVGTYYGGGVVNSGVMEIANSTIYDNHAWWEGGGLIAYGTVTVRRSIIVDNMSEQGGGIYVPRGGTLTMYNSTLSGNYAEAFHFGGIYSGGIVNLQHVTITDNAGGGVYGGILNMSNTIIANSVGGPDCAVSTVGTNSSNLVEDGSCNATYRGDPLLAPLALNAPGDTETHALLEGSPAIDRGDPAYCLNHDQRGVARPIGTGCDIGAYESEFSVERRELLKNGEFNDGLNFWQKYPTHTWVQVKDGGDNFIATWPWKDYVVWQEGLAVNSGQQYTACAELMTTTTYPYLVNLRLTEGGTIIGLDQPLAKGYHCFDFTAAKTTSNARFELYFVLINTAGTRLDFDSLSLNTPVTAPAPPTNTPTATATSTGEPPTATPTNTPTNTPTSTPTDTPPAGDELVRNGEFDDGLNFWQKNPTHTWVQVKDGGDNFIATWPWKGYTFWQDGIAVTGGKSYKACAELMTTTTYPYQVNLRLTDGGTIIGLDRPLAKGNNCFNFTATKTTSTAHLELYYVLINTPGTRLDFDSISLIGEDGGVPPTATNTPTATPTGEPPTATPTATATNTPAPSAELLRNGGFDDNFLYWSKAPTHDWVFVRRDGDNKYIATYPWNGYRVYQNGLNIAAGQSYTACADSWTDTTYSYQVNLRLTNGADVIGLDRQLAEGSNCFSFTATQSTGSGQLELYFSSLRTGGTLLNFDNLSLSPN